MKYQEVQLTLKIMVPDQIGDNEDLCDYLNDKLYEDPEFYGFIDTGCVEYTGYSYSEEDE